MILFYKKYKRKNGCGIRKKRELTATSINILRKLGYKIKHG